MRIPRLQHDTLSPQRRGVAAVEFAIVAPMLVMLVFGIIEVGRLMVVQQVLTNASREGARQAVVHRSTGTDVESVVTNHLKNGSVSHATVTVTPSDLSTMDFGDPVTVNVSVPFDRISWLPSPFFFGGRVLSAETIMRAESP